MIMGRHGPPLHAEPSATAVAKKNRLRVGIETRSDADGLFLLPFDKSRIDSASHRLVFSGGHTKNKAIALPQIRLN